MRGFFMSAVLREERDTIPWRSKIDDQGRTHVYKRITAAELRAGDHILEHVTGHAKPVATPILSVKHAPDGVIVTIPDRHSDESPVAELYRSDAPVFISKTPHLEQYDPEKDLFFNSQTQKESAMEDENFAAPWKQAANGLRTTQVRIDAGVENLILTQDVTRAREASQAVQAGATDLSNRIILGSEAVAESFKTDAHVTGYWNAALTDSVAFTSSRSRRLDGYAKAVDHQELREAAAYARGALDTATQVALEQRKRGILMSLTGPLADYAIQDARNLGMLAQSVKEETGLVLGKASPEALLQREDGSWTAVPMAKADLSKLEVGQSVSLVADEIGVYRRKEITMEKQAEVKKQEYPRMEAHVKTPEGTWHSVGMYVDKEGQARGIIAVENKERGIAEKHSVQFAEKVSEKTGEKFLSAKVDRENGKTLYLNIMPHENEKDGERWLSAQFAERDPNKERGQQLSAIEGKGGDMKPNAALLEKADKDRTAQYVRETLKVDPVQVHERSQARKQGKGLER